MNRIEQLKSADLRRGKFCPDPDSNYFQDLTETFLLKIRLMTKFYEDPISFFFARDMMQIMEKCSMSQC